MAVKRAARCIVSGLGWLYVRDEHAKLLEKSGPKKADPDGRISGQLPAFTSWGAAQVAEFVKGDDFYQSQIREQVRIVEKELGIAQASANAAQSDRDRIQETLDGIKQLLDPQ